MRLSVPIMLLVAACDCGRAEAVDAGDAEASRDAHDQDSFADVGVDVVEPDVVESDVAGDVLRDAGADAADALSDVGVLPSVEPGLECPADGSSDVACFDSGWFVLAQWSPLYFTDVELDGQSGDAPHVRRPVYLDRFWLDTLEVTLSEYNAWAADNGLGPAFCGPSSGPDRAIWVTDCFDCSGAEEWPMTTRFRDAPAGDHPVSCVTAAEATAYCEARGGRLPTPHEWFRSAGVPYDPERPETVRRFPWGNDLPDPYYWEPYAGGMPRVFAPRSYDPLVTAGRGPVGRFGVLASDNGVEGMTGGVSEWLSGCESMIREATTEPVVRPDAGGCVGELLAGNHWLSSTSGAGRAASTLMSYGLFRYDDSRPPNYFFQYVGPSAHANVQESRIGRQVTNPNGPKNWVVGFRCAYDEEPL